MFILLLLLLKDVDTASKKWIATSQWSEEAHWVGGLPTGCDTALLEQNQVLHMTGQSNIADISFSGDGAIVFDGFSELSFGQGSNSDSGNGWCSGKSVKMFESDRHEFLSPDNWELEGQDQDTFLPLDVNKIPCHSDVIELPSKTLRATLSSDVSVGAVSYGGQVKSKTEVRDWLNSPQGRQELRLLASFNVNGRPFCHIPGGCECGNQVSCNASVCEPLCSNPIRSPTMCCPVCGSILSVPVQHQESLSKLEIELSKEVSKLSFPPAFFMGLYRGELHIIAKERNHGLSATAAIKHITDFLIQRGYIIDNNFTILQSSSRLQIEQLSPENRISFPLLVVGSLLLLILFAIFIIVLIRCRKIPFLQPVPTHQSLQHHTNDYDTIGQEHIYESVQQFQRSKPKYSISDIRSLEGFPLREDQALSELDIIKLSPLVKPVCDSVTSL